MIQDFDSIVSLLINDDLQSLAHHRHREDWVIAHDTTETFLLKAPATKENLAAFTSIPCIKRWQLKEPNQLIPFGSSLPNRVIPMLDWKALSSSLLVLPATAKANEPYFGHTILTLIASDSPAEASAILIEKQQLKKWCDTAPAPRLDKLKIAVSSTEKILISGTPLPPISGNSFYSIGQPFSIP